MSRQTDMTPPPKTRTRSDRLAHLIRGLAPTHTIPELEEQRWILFRALVNLRRPGPVGEEWLQVQDAFLQEESRSKGIVSIDDLSPIRPHLYLWQGDITRIQTDAIVNAANADLRGCFHPNHSCIDNAIHTFAGVQLRNECDALMQAQRHPEPAGRAKITQAYNLPASYVLHTVGPIVGERLTGEQRDLLSACYASCLKAADAQGLESVAFCCISTGEYGFSNEPAAEIAIKTVLDTQAGCRSVQRVVFNVFKDLDESIYRSLLSDL